MHSRKIYINELKHTLSFVYTASCVDITHVRSCPLLPGQLLLLSVGRGHLQVKHRLQPSGASIDPLTPLIILINNK